MLDCSDVVLQIVDARNGMYICMYVQYASIYTVFEINIRIHRDNCICACLSIAIMIMNHFIKCVYL